MEQATYLGVSVNATLSFTVPQAVAVGEAIERGLVRREAEGLDVSTMGPVVTIMGGRLDDWLKKVVARDAITIDPGYLEWAGVAALKRGYHVFQERGFRSRILSAAFRNHMQWSELVGGDLVVSPPFSWQQKFNTSGIDPISRIDEPVDPRIIDALSSKIPDFSRAYEVDGMTARSSRISDPAASPCGSSWLPTRTWTLSCATSLCPPPATSSTFPSVATGHGGELTGPTRSLSGTAASSRCPIAA
jgi:transaldolase